MQLPNKSAAPRVSVVVNNHNYRDYVGEAVDSALGQTRPVQQIVVVDDGSTDGSADLLRERYASRPEVLVVSKGNGGQLSAINEGCRLADGDIMFFLDADDRYEPDYVEASLRYFEDRATDMLITATRKFGGVDGVWRVFDTDRHVGVQVLLALYRYKSTGGPTSALAIRREVLDRFMPVPLEPMWRVRADDCLVLGATIAGARKQYAAEPRVLYRVHGRNHWHGRRHDDREIVRYELARNALHGHVVRKMGYLESTLIDTIKWEFRSSPHPRSWGERRDYLKIVMGSGRSLLWKLRQALRVIRAGRHVPEAGKS